MDTLHLAAAIFLFDGRGDESAFEMMQDEGAFARLVTLISDRRDDASGLYRMLLELLFEMARIQKLTREDMVVIDDDTILYRDGRTTYVNKPLGSCNLLSRGSYALVTRSQGSQLCRGDIATVTDVTSGTTVGSCALGDFVPYKPAI